MVLAFGNVMSCSFCPNMKLSDLCVLLVMLLHLLYIHHLQDGMGIGSSLYDDEGAKIVPDILKKVHCLLFAYISHQEA